MVRTLRAVLFSMILFMSSTASAEVASSADKIMPLKVGDRLPSAQVRNIKGEQIDLTEALGQQPAVIIFYRGGW